VKGHVEIFEEDGDYVLHRKPSGEALAPGEKALLQALFEDGGLVALKQANHRLLAGAKEAHRKALKRDYEKIYFITNAALLLPAAGAILALGLAVGLLDA
ncbi:hypothetical protein RZS08_04900, partial [Arthrospira platensis SPKY1]|nr:hypothetical protein [Arthrospira platensis SPKY1]